MLLLPTFHILWNLLLLLSETRVMQWKEGYAGVPWGFVRRVL